MLVPRSRQFTIRSLMIVVALMALISAMIAYFRAHQVRHADRAHLRINRNGDGFRRSPLPGLARLGLVPAASARAEIPEEGFDQVRP